MKPSPRESKVVLNTLGTPQMVPAIAAESHLVGAAALVRGSKLQKQAEQAAEASAGVLHLPVLGECRARMQAAHVTQARSRESRQLRQAATHESQTSLMVWPSRLRNGHAPQTVWHIPS